MRITKVMTFNIRYENHYDVDNSWSDRKDSVINLILNHNPDILGIQEALPGPYKFLTSRLTAFDSVGVGREDGINQGERAAVFYSRSRYKLLESDNIWLSETSNTPSVGWDACTQRIATYARLLDKTNNTIVNVFNTHFDHEGTIARIESAHLIIYYNRTKHLDNERIIFMGDLNSFPDSEAIDILSSFFNESSSISKIQPECTGPTYNDFSESPEKQARIDYIFTRNLVVNSYKVIKTRRDNNKFISDHYPITISVE